MNPTAIREALEARGLSQVAVGELLGIQQSAVSKRVRGERIWPAADVKLLADRLGCTTDDLLADRLPDETRARLQAARDAEAVSA
jgi:transcriptional regulator with XRE-family HTH domain